MAVDREAALLGLAPGMKLADARARVPDLLAFDHDPRADALMLEQLAQACMRYTPMVAIAADHALSLDITGCTHFFASETALAQDAQDRLDHAGYSAATADAALALARFGLKEGAEAQLPVSALAMDDKNHRALERAGLYQIGDLAVRPRSSLAARFGGDLMRRLDRILGQDDRPVQPMEMQAKIMAERRFLDPLTQVEAATRCLAELFTKAAIQLEQRKQGARMITMLLFRCDGDVARLGIETAAPTRSTGLFKRLLEERINALHDALNPGFGYDLIRLSITITQPMGHQQMRLQEGSNIPDQDQDITALVSQLSVRLGRQNVQKFLPGNSHIPEQAVRAFPLLDNHSTQAWPQATDGHTPARPLHLFDPPQHITVVAEVPDGPPYRFTWRRTLYQVVRHEGPERIASEWWQHKAGQQDGKGGLTRDYYRVEDQKGRRYWLFRHGLYGQEKATPGWYIHGLFA